MCRKVIGVVVFKRCELSTSNDVPMVTFELKLTNLGRFRVPFIHKNQSFGVGQNKEISSTTLADFRKFEASQTCQFEIKSDRWQFIRCAKITSLECKSIHESA